MQSQKSKHQIQETRNKKPETRDINVSNVSLRLQHIIFEPRNDKYKIQKYKICSTECHCGVVFFTLHLKFKIPKSLSKRRILNKKFQILSSLLRVNRL